MLFSYSFRIIQLINTRDFLSKPEPGDLELRKEAFKSILFFGGVSLLKLNIGSREIPVSWVDLTSIREEPSLLLLFRSSSSILESSLNEPFNVFVVFDGGRGGWGGFEDDDKPKWLVTRLLLLSAARLLPRDDESMLVSAMKKLCMLICLPELPLNDMNESSSPAPPPIELVIDSGRPLALLPLLLLLLSILMRASLIRIVFTNGRVNLNSF